MPNPKLTLSVIAPSKGNLLLKNVFVNEVDVRGFAGKVVVKVDMC